MRALLTGGTGFVGANLARRLLADGHEVHLLIRPQRAGWRIEDIADDLTLHTADIGDLGQVRATVRAARPEWVFHLAAFGAYSQQTDLATILATNVMGTSNLVTACVEAGFEAFVNTGSSSEYGFKDHAPREDELVEPNSHYAVTKVFGTHLCRYTATKHGAHMPTLRLYSVYGPWEEPTRLMPAMALHAMGGTLPPLADPSVARDYVYVDDVSDAFVRAARAAGAVPPDSVYNVATGVQTTLRQLVDVVRRIMPVTPEPSWGSMPNRSWDTSVWVGDSGRIQADLGWSSAHTVESGFGRYVDWYRGHPDLETAHRNLLRH